MVERKCIENAKRQRVPCSAAEGAPFSNQDTLRALDDALADASRSQCTSSVRSAKARDAVRRIRLFELRDFLLRQANRERGDGFLEVMRFRGADDGRSHN